MSFHRFFCHIIPLKGANKKKSVLHNQIMHAEYINKDSVIHNHNYITGRDKGNNFG